MRPMNRTAIDLDVFVGAIKLALENGDVVSYRHYMYDFAFDDKYAYPIVDFNLPRGYKRQEGEVLQ